RGAAAEVAEHQPGARLRRLLEDEKRVVKLEERLFYEFDFQAKNGEDDLQRESGHDCAPRDRATALPHQPRQSEQPGDARRRVHKIPLHWFPLCPGTIPSPVSAPNGATPASNTGPAFSSWRSSSRAPSSAGSTSRTMPTRSATWRSRTSRPSGLRAASRCCFTARNCRSTRTCGSCSKSYLAKTPEMVFWMPAAAARGSVASRIGRPTTM